MRGTPVLSLRRWLWPSLIALALAVGGPGLGCGDPDDDDNQNDDGPPRRPNQTTSVEWDIQALEYPQSVGFRLRMGLAPDGRIGLAFFEFFGESGESCDEIGDDPPNKIMWTLHYAEKPRGGAWAQEIIHQVPYVGSPPGLDLVFDNDGQAIVATMTGEPVPEIRYCGVNDVGVLFREGPESWTEETAVSESGEAATGHPSSDFGYVVGYWPGLALTSEGEPAVAYRDVHGGGIQADDFRRADLEYTWRSGGSWDVEPVDWGNGAGEYNRLLFDSEDQPVIAYYVGQESRMTEQLGYWLAWKDDGEWRMTHLFNRGNTEEPSIAIDPSTGALLFAFYDSEFGAPRLATLEDWDSFEQPSQWEFQEIGDQTYDEGYSPSLAVSESGYLGVAYHRCNLASEGLGNCSPARTALVFAYQTDGEWTQEVVEEGRSLAVCGQAPTLEFDGDEAVIAYRCEVYDEESETVSTEVRVARRPAL